MRLAFILLSFAGWIALPCPNMALAQDLADPQGEEPPPLPALEDLGSSQSVVPAELERPTLHSDDAPGALMMEDTEPFEAPSQGAPSNNVLPVKKEPLQREAVKQDSQKKTPKLNKKKAAASVKNKGTPKTNKSANKLAKKSTKKSKIKTSKASLKGKPSKKSKASKKG